MPCILYIKCRSVDVFFSVIMVNSCKGYSSSSVHSLMVCSCVLCQQRLFTIYLFYMVFGILFYFFFILCGNFPILHSLLSLISLIFVIFVVECSGLFLDPDPHAHLLFPHVILPVSRGACPNTWTNMSRYICYESAVWAIGHMTPKHESPSRLFLCAFPP